MSFYITVLFLLLGMLSCGKKIDCTDPPINISFISFTQAELDTIVVRKFHKDNSFQNLIDTFLIPSTRGSIVARGDTSHMSLYHPNNYLEPEFDWQIFIPAINRTVSITNILKENRSEKCAGFTECSCYNEIKSIRVDNQNGTFQTFPGFTAYTLFIRR